MKLPSRPGIAGLALSSDGRGETTQGQGRRWTLGSGVGAVPTGETGGDVGGVGVREEAKGLGQVSATGLSRGSRARCILLVDQLRGGRGQTGD